MERDTLWSVQDERIDWVLLCQYDRNQYNEQTICLLYKQALLLHCISCHMWESEENVVPYQEHRIANSVDWLSSSLVSMELLELCCTISFRSIDRRSVISQLTLFMIHTTKSLRNVIVFFRHFFRSHQDWNDSSPRYKWRKISLVCKFRRMILPFHSHFIALHYNIESNLL